MLGGASVPEGPAGAGWTMVIISLVLTAWTRNGLAPSASLHDLSRRHFNGGLSVSWTVIVCSRGAGVETWPRARTATVSTSNTGPIQYDRSIRGVSFPARGGRSR